MIKKSFKRIIRIIFSPIIRKRFSKKGIYIDGYSYTIDGSCFGGNNAIGGGSVVMNSEIGRGTYFGSHVNFTNALVGGFCSIGQRVQILAEQHPIRTFVSSSPLFYSNLNKCKSYVDNEKYPHYKYVNGTKYKVVIGNDVWIGNDVTILGGVVVGDGAVIGTGAVVTKNVEPYSIVVGIPAKHIAFRFNKETINVLLEIKWWEKTDDWLLKHRELFLDINSFLKQIKTV